MKRFEIPLSYNPIDVDRLSALLHSYDARHHDQLIHDFERKLAEYMGVPFALALNSGTSAIHLGLKALGVGPGDLVVASSFTYVATVNPILYLGAVPVFVDSERRTWNIDPGLLEEAIVQCNQEGKRPKAIVAVHTYGMPAQMNDILGVAKKYEIPILEDAAEAIGSSFGNKSMGSLGEAGVLSFNNNKILTTYGGGALLTRSKEVYDKVLHWSTQSRENLPYYEHAELGYNYRMGALNAAMGMVQLASIDEKVRRRQEIFSAYTHHLEKLPGIEWQKEPTGGFSNRWISSFVLTSRLEEVRNALEQLQIETRPLWKPMHIQPVFKSYRSFLNGTSSYLFQNGLCLPSGNDLSNAQIELICRKSLKMGINL